MSSGGPGTTAHGDTYFRIEQVVFGSMISLHTIGVWVDHTHSDQSVHHLGLHMLCGLAQMGSRARW